MAEVCYGPAAGLPDASVLTEAAKELSEICDSTARGEAVRAVFRLVDAVIAAPEDVGKRRVRKANAAFQQRVGRHPAALRFLAGVGFVEGEDAASPSEAVLTMHIAYVSRLTDAHHVLAGAARQAGLPVPELPTGSFNPYQSSCQRTDAGRAPTAPSEWQSEAERLRREVRQREAEVQARLRSAPSVSLRPVSFWLSAGRRIEDAIRETAELPSEDVGDQALLMSKLAGAKAAGGSKFESADKGRLAELARTRIHEICVLRVICPDKSVLQAHFRAADTGEQVMAQLAPLLNARVREVSWYLYQSPPVRRLAAGETLAAAGLTPGANMYLGIEGTKLSPPFLEPSLASKLGPPLQVAQQAQAQETSATEGGRDGEGTFGGQGRKLVDDQATGHATATEAAGGGAQAVAVRSVGSFRATGDGSMAAGSSPPVATMKSVGSFRAAGAGAEIPMPLQRAILSKDKNLKAGFDRASHSASDAPEQPILQDEVVKPSMLMGWFPFCCTPTH